jgi:hypothetical protein
MQQSKNPFPVSGYYDPEFFCDRLFELKDLEENVQNGRNVVYYGWRRLGKTAFIKHFGNTISKSKKSRLIYIDLYSVNNIQGALAKTVSAVFNTYGNLEKTFGSALTQLIGRLGFSMGINPLTGMPEIDMSIKPNHEPKLSLSQIGNYLNSKKEQIILVFDEFQQIAHFDENSEAIFREFMQEFPELRFIFSGSHKGMMVSMFSDKNRPFYKSCQLREITPIPLPSYQTFIQKHFLQGERKISTSLIEQIYTWARGETYTIQLMCNKLYALGSSVEDDDFKQIQEAEMHEQSAFFSSYQRLLTKTQWKLMCAVATDEPLRNPTSKDFLRKHELGAASSVTRALNALLEKEVVIKEGDMYLVQDVLLARWLVWI